MLVHAQDTNVLAAGDPLGIVYHIEDSHQFWLGEPRIIIVEAKPVNLIVKLDIELEDVIHIPSESTPTLSMLDSALKRFMSLCTSYHGEPHHHFFNDVFDSHAQNNIYKAHSSSNMPASSYLIPNYSLFILNGCAKF